MIKWYENISKELNIPMYIIDIPFNPDYEVSDAEVEYIREQFWDVIHQLEAYTGKKWSDERFKEVMEISGRASRAWIEATSQAKYVPSPFNGFDLLNHMAVMVTARGKTEAAEAMEVLLKEYKENHEKGVSTFRAEESTASCSRASHAGPGCGLPPQDSRAEASTWLPPFTQTLSATYTTTLTRCAAYTQRFPTP